jgi:hypothetical protein
MASLAPSSSLPLAAEVLLEAEALSGPQAQLYARLLEAEALSGPQAQLYARLREAEERYNLAYTEAQGGCSLRSPSTGSTSTTWYLGAMQDDIDAIRKELGLKPIYSLSAVAEADEDVVNLSVSAPAPPPVPLHPLQNKVGAALTTLFPPSVGPSAARSMSSHGLGWGSPALGRTMTGTLAASPLVRVNAFAAPADTFRGAAESAAGAGGGIASVMAFEDDSEVDALMGQLRTLRATLQTRQAAVYEDGARSHDEMQMADQEWEDLDTKIHAIEGVLTAFRQVFRTG